MGIVEVISLAKSPLQHTYPPSSSHGPTTTTPPTPSPTEPSGDLQTLYTRRLPFIISSVTGLDSIPVWLSTLSVDGKWPDVDYTTGCTAQRANWPAQTHWNRINTLAAAYHGASDFKANTSAFLHDPVVRKALTSAMNWWFSNDFTNINCLDSGGNSTCPCGTAGMWNTNWFSNIILIPRLVGQACLLLLQAPDPLTSTQLSNCTHFTSRSFSTFNYTHINGLGTLTGANTLDVATSCTQAYGRVHAEVVVQTATRADGIRPDFSFAQHNGQLYDGNYGKDYSNDVLALESQAANTQWEAGTPSRSAFTGYVDGFQWAIVQNVITRVLHWDLSTLGRFISFPVADQQATSSIKINLTQIDVLGQQWGVPEMSTIARGLKKPSQSANAGSLVGNRMFWDTDYMVHRGSKYVTTLKMYSDRTTNTECTNSQNPFGFHLSDGTLYTYLDGSEYEDIAAAWDWNLIPGTTVDYGNTPLTCQTAGQSGVESFVGGVSDGKVGVAAMRYTNPITKTFGFQKAWFFFQGDVQHVLVSSIMSTSGAAVRNVIDQKRLSGPVYVDGALVSSGTFPNVTTLWHANVGYILDPPVLGGNSLTLATGNKTGSWAPLGISKQPDVNVALFTASIDQDPPQLDKRVSYSIYPGVSLAHFTQVAGSKGSDAGPPITIQNDATISAVLDSTRKTAGIVFWAPGGGTVKIPFAGPLVEADQAVALIVRLDSWEISVSDPSQTLTSVSITLTWDISQSPNPGEGSRNFVIDLPQGDGMRGSSVKRSLR
ncbi:polysaccharide lyase family 8 protein [Hydnum rufescens UP504]|uniref:Polysaccharide lyase family 8 protein n=1 Tax=Hydnum rufescens UP504 TaxID=1448309 RepID=A0A9P6AYC3_9AGAM|nr:polysaccharide lyase family 8 protein [Hydnum rufescens UP504]